MPITMGGRCDIRPNPPVRPPHNPGPTPNPNPNPNPAPNPNPNPNPAPNPGTPGGSGSGSGNQGGSGSGSNGGSQGGSGSGGAGAAAGFDAMYLGSLPIAMAYTPMQQWKTTYSLEKGLAQGTIFPELDLPFEGRTILTEQARGGRK